MRANHCIETPHLPSSPSRGARRLTCLCCSPLCATQNCPTMRSTTTRSAREPPTSAMRTAAQLSSLTRHRHRLILRLLLSVCQSDPSGLRLRLQQADVSGRSACAARAVVSRAAGCAVVASLLACRCRPSSGWTCRTTCSSQCPPACPPCPACPRCTCTATPSPRCPRCRCCCRCSA